MNQDRSRFFTVPEDALEQAVCRLTYLGEQTKPVPSVVFATDRPRMDAFTRLPERAAVHANDRAVEPAFVTCSSEELGGLMAAARDRAWPTVEPRPFLSFAALRLPSGEAWGDEGFIPRTEAAELLSRMSAALDADNAAAHAALATFRLRIGV